ncbi:hypothetical protein [Clostridium weizhouense]|uniref:Uncharacterized protein n=1 Tax=Clostridium weizhouense TaxID=2859781 RepID=A0ABS7ALL4_9CLOT|nr:hypothetical protein [Clostridium weizhouense]MBW6409544.1 hypothetical protein [Clostridium weizhouense]
MGNLIKIAMYAEKRKKNRTVNIEMLEKHILRYNRWLKQTNREDKIESYECFLQSH